MVHVEDRYTVFFFSLAPVDFSEIGGIVDTPVGPVLQVDDPDGAFAVSQKSLFAVPVGSRRHASGNGLRVRAVLLQHLGKSRDATG